MKERKNSNKSGGGFGFNKYRYYTKETSYLVLHCERGKIVAKHVIDRIAVRLCKKHFIA